MDFETLRQYCLSLKGTSEGFPFDETTLVFKVMGKMFALTGLDNEPMAVNLKCNPDLALEYREHFEEIQPGFHMNKKHWNTVNLEGNLEEDFLLELIQHSYELVVKGLPKKLKEELSNL